MSEPQRPARVLEGVTPYHWLVVIIASCGWLFDCMDQRLFILARESALRELLQDDRRGARQREDLHRLRDDGDDPRLGHGRHLLRHDERQDRAGEDDGRDAAGVLRVHRAVRACANAGWTSRSTAFSSGSGVGGMFGAATTLVAESVPGGFRSVALGSLQALSATGNIMGSLISLAIPPGQAEFPGATPGGGCCSSSAFCPPCWWCPSSSCCASRKRGSRPRPRPRAGARTSMSARPWNCFRTALAAEHDRRPAAGRVRHDRPVGHRVLLARTHLHRAQGRAAGRSWTRCAAGARRCRTLGAFAGHDGRSRSWPRS